MPSVCYSFLRLNAHRVALYLLFESQLDQLCYHALDAWPVTVQKRGVIELVALGVLRDEPAPVHDFLVLAQQFDLGRNCLF